MLDDYDAWLDRQALAARTRSAYRRWVRELVEHLVAGGELEAFVAPDGETIAARSSATGAGGWSIVGWRRRR